LPELRTAGRAVRGEVHADDPDIRQGTRHRRLVAEGRHARWMHPVRPDRAHRGVPGVRTAGRRAVRYRQIEHRCCDRTTTLARNGQRTASTSSSTVQILPGGPEIFVTEVAVYQSSTSPVLVQYQSLPTLTNPYQSGTRGGPAPVAVGRLSEEQTSIEHPPSGGPGAGYRDKGQPSTFAFTCRWVTQSQTDPNRRRQRG